MAVAETLAMLAWFNAFQFWLGEILPDTFKLPKARCALVGNGVFVLVQVAYMSVEWLVYAI